MVGTRALEKYMAPIKRRVALGIGRAILRAVSDVAGLQRVQVEALAGEVIDNAERFQQYGYTSHPHDGAEAVVLALGGNRNHPIVISVDDRRFRLLALEAGEVAIYDDLDQVVHLQRDRILVTSPKDITVSAGETVRIEGKRVEVYASEQIRWDVYGYGEDWNWDGMNHWADTWKLGPTVIPGDDYLVAPPEHDSAGGVLP